MRPRFLPSPTREQCGMRTHIVCRYITLIIWSVGLAFGGIYFAQQSIQLGLVVAQTGNVTELGLEFVLVAATLMVLRVLVTIPLALRMKWRTVPTWVSACDGAIIGIIAVGFVVVVVSLLWRHYGH